MSKNLESAKGHAKNARNMLQSMEIGVRTGRNEPDVDDVQYCLEEVLKSIEAIDAAMEEDG